MRASALIQCVAVDTFDNICVAVSVSNILPVNVHFSHVRPYLVVDSTAPSIALCITRSVSSLRLILQFDRAGLSSDGRVRVTMCAT
jgi:hypothetical protein